MNRSSCSRLTGFLLLLVAAGALVLFLQTREDDIAISEESGRGRGPVTRTRSLPDNAKRNASDAPSVHEERSRTIPDHREKLTLRDSESLLYGAVLSSVDETPLVNATIRLLSERRPATVPGESPRESLTSSDMNGAWEMRPSADLHQDVSHNRWRVVAMAPDHAAQVVSVANGMDMKTRVFRHDFVLGPGGAIEGRVITSEGIGVGGARIHSQAGNLQSDEVAYQLESTADAEGFFLLRGVPPERAFVLTGRADGYLQGASAPVFSGARDVLIRLAESEARIRGSVTDHEGRAAPSVVTVRGDNGSLSFEETVETETNGTFSFPDVLVGRLKVTAEETTHGKRAQADVTVRVGEEAVVNLVYAAPAVIRGRAVDVATRHGVGGVVLSARGFGAEQQDHGTAHVTTGPDGLFEIELPVGADRRGLLFYRLPAGWLAADGSVRGSHGFPGLAAGEKREFDLLLRAGVTVPGMVRSWDGTGVSDASVTAKSAVQGGAGSTKTSEDGRFELTLARGAQVRFSASAGHGTGSLGYDVPLKGTPPDAIIELEEHGGVSGFVNARDEPVGGVTVYATNVNERIGSGVTTDAAGYYENANVRPGTVIISLSVPDTLGYASPEPLEVKVSPGQTTDGVNFELDRGDVVEGVVFDDTGTGIRDAGVIWKMPVAGVTATQVRSTRTDIDGYFRIEGIAGGISLPEVSAGAEGWHTEKRNEVTARDSPLAFVLQRKHDVTVRVLSGTPDTSVEAWEWRLHSVPERGVVYAGSPRPWTQADQGADAVVIPDLDVGAYHVEVREPVDELLSARTGSARFRIHKGVRPNDVEIDLEGGADVTGRVVADEQGTPVESALISLLPPGTRTSGPPAAGLGLIETLSDEAGHFVLSGVSNGPWAVAASRAGIARFRDIEVMEGESNEPLEFLIALNGTVTGVVTDAEGERRLDYRLNYESDVILPDGSPGKRESGVIVPEAGERFRLEDLQVGRHLMNVTDAETAEETRLVFPVYSGFENSTLNVDFSSQIRLTGRVTINGTPWNGTPSLLLLNRGNQYLEMTAPGLYAVNAWPGDCTLALRRDARTVRTNERFELTAQPAQQVRDMALELADADVVVVFPEGEEYREGHITLVDVVDPIAGWKVTAMEEVSRSGSMLATSLIPRGYEATYEDLSGQWEGESHLVAIAPERENVLIIEARPVDASLLVGTWSPETISGTWTDYVYDVTPLVMTGGQYEALLLHEGGNDGVEISGAVLLRNGQEIARDDHAGWSGIEKRFHIYTLNVSDGGSGVFTLRVRMRAAAGGDTTGVVYFRR